MADVFISYKREDQQVAQQIADTLAAEGWDIWWDPELRAGELYDNVIEQALNDARCVLVVWSSRAVASQYVRDEAALALEQHKLVPVRIDDAELPFRFRGLHTLDFSSWNGSDDDPAAQELVADLRSLIGEPGKPREAGVGRRTITAAAPWWRSRQFRYASFGVIGLLAALSVMKILDRNGTDSNGRPVADCLLDVQVEKLGEQLEIRFVELVSGGTVRRFPATGNRSTITVGADNLDSWQINVVWEGSEQSTFRGLSGCPAGQTRSSDDDTARISFPTP